FFQAEDGIRDLIVTGVQTCALPISRRHAGDQLLVVLAVPGLVEAELLVQRLLLDVRQDGDAPAQAGLAVLGLQGRGREVAVGVRSEERRVGKEWRCGWGRDR